MRRSDFHFDLPPELIAQRPRERRSSARMLCLQEDGAFEDRVVNDLSSLVQAGDLLVFNDTRVIPARLFGRKESGGRVEILVERLLDERHFLAQLRASKTTRPGTRIRIDGEFATLCVEGVNPPFFRLSVAEGTTALDLLDRVGHIPLPPYIERGDEDADRERYQTIFASRPGAVAAPTAGLHFDPPLIAALEARSTRIEMVTLHVGAGTFQPMRVDDVAAHRMHAERYAISPRLATAFTETRARGGRVIAIGTTTVRALESAALGPDGTRAMALAEGEAETRIFITPGYRFRAVDALLTNFHLPESTLLMLVSAFAGWDRTRAAYLHAVQQRYRFFSYGDAMWIPAPAAGSDAT